MEPTQRYNVYKLLRHPFLIEDKPKPIEKDENDMIVQVENNEYQDDHNYDNDKKEEENKKLRKRKLIERKFKHIDSLNDNKIDVEGVEIKYKDDEQDKQEKEEDKNKNRKRKLIERKAKTKSDVKKDEGQDGEDNDN